MRDFVKYLPVIGLAVGAIVVLWILSKRKPREQIQDPFLSGDSNDLINHQASTPGFRLGAAQRQAIRDIRAIPTVHTLGTGRFLPQ